MPDSRAHLDTERANPASVELDRLDTRRALELFAAADLEAARAVAEADEMIAKAVDLIAARLAAGGRLFYLGAGTSGRLGTLDAAECPPTFQSDPELVQALLAGGPEALTRAVEGAEDSSAGGAARVADARVGERDVVLGIAAGGTTPFVHGALDEAARRSAATIFATCVPAAQVPDRGDVTIRLLTGPELLAGSTRLKAGTATKMALNRISTLVMVRLGKVHGNLMVDVNTTGNAKLLARGRSLVGTLTGLDEARCAELLDAAGGRVKLAALMGAAGLERGPAEERLTRAGGFLRRALEAP